MAKRNYGRMTADGGLSLFRPMQLNLTMPTAPLRGGDQTCLRRKRSVAAGITSERGIGARLAHEPTADPVAKCLPHHQLEVTPRQPGELLGKHCNALSPGAGHAGDVGSPENLLGPNAS